MPPVRQPEPAPPTSESEADKPDFILPPVPDSAVDGKRQLSTELTIWVNRIELEGNRVFSTEELQVITQPYEQRLLTTDQLQQLRLALSQHYVDRGYINSGAILPDQSIEQGVIRIQIIEGTLNTIDVTGLNGLSPDYVRKRIKLGVTRPLNVQALQQHLLLLKQDPLVEQINARLQPGLRPGESELSIQIEESRPYQLGVIASNHRSPSIGAESAQLWAQHGNLTGIGDRLYFSYGLTEGLDSIATRYSLPLNAYDTRLEFSFNRSDSEVIESLTHQPGEPRFASAFESYQLGVTHPLYETSQTRLALTLAFQHLRSQTRIIGSGGFAAPGSGVSADDGKTRIAALRLTQDWLQRSLNQVIAVRSRFSIGIDAFGATLDDGLSGVNKSAANARYFAWLGQFQWVRRLPSLWNSLLIVRTDLQFASEPLLPLEKFSIGGANSVRGYRENQLVRDNGLSASLEWRVPVFRLPVPLLSQRLDEGQVALAPFVDFGWSENIEQGSPTPRTLGSAGIGLRWDPSRNVSSQVYWAHPFRKIHNSQHDLQDSGVHFRVSINVF